MVAPPPASHLASRREEGTGQTTKESEKGKKRSALNVRINLFYNFELEIIQLFYILKTKPKRRKPATSYVVMLCMLMEH